MAKKNTKKDEVKNGESEVLETTATETVTTVETNEEVVEEAPVENTEPLCDLPADEQPTIETVPNEGVPEDDVTETNEEEAPVEKQVCTLKLDKGVEVTTKVIRDKEYLCFEFGGGVRYVPTKHCEYDKKAHAIHIPEYIFEALKFTAE